MSVQASSVRDVTVRNVFHSHGPARRGAPGPPRQLPAAVRAGVWIDRAREMEELTTVAAEPGPVLVVLVGAKEVGTSALATQWLQSNAGRFGDGQFFADLRAAGDPTSAGDVLGWWLSVLGVEVPDAPAARSAAWRSATAEGAYAVLLDHVTSEDQVLPILMSSPASVMVVTSNRPLPGLVSRDARHVGVEPLDADHAMVLLDRLAGPRGHRRLADRCHGRPGRIRRAAACLLNDSTTTTAGEVSTEMIYSVLPDRAQELLRRIGDHVPTVDVVTAAAMLAADRAAAEEVLEVLVDSAVLAKRPAPAEGLLPRYVMATQDHAAAAEYAASDPPEFRDDARRRVTEAVGERLVEADYVLNPLAPRFNPAFERYQREGVAAGLDEHAALQLVITELRAMQVLMRAAYDAGEYSTVCHLAESTWSAYLMAGFHDQLIALFELAVAAARHAGHPMESAALARLSWGYRAKQRWQDAIDTATTARDVAARREDRRAESTAVSAIARVHRARGQYVSARREFWKSLLLAVQGGDIRGVGLRSRHIGDCWAAQDQPLPAKEWYEYALEIADDQQDLLNWARAAGKLGSVLTKLGEARQALGYLHRAADIMASRSNRYHADVVAAQARAHRALGEFSDARRHYSTAERLYHAAGETNIADTMRAEREQTN